MKVQEEGKMERERDVRLWDAAREVPDIEDQQTPWKMIKLLKIVALCVVAVIVFGSALCSKVSFLLLVTLSNEGTKTLPDNMRPVALLCIGCILISSSVLVFIKSMWKACYKTSKLPRKSTLSLVLLVEFLVAMGAAILTIVAMPHLDIVTNVTILNGVAVLSTLLQVITQCTAKERNRFLVPSITAFLLILLGYVLFLFLYVTKDLTDTRRITWAGLAVGGSVLMSFNWWENYFKLISKNLQNSKKSPKDTEDPKYRPPSFLTALCEDVTACQNVLYMLSSLLRIAVTAGVLGAYVPLDNLDWAVVTSIPSRETRIIAIIIGVQLISSVLCHWFSLVACKMHALRRCFILPLYLASLAVMVLFIVPVIVFHQNYRNRLNGIQSSDFAGYCNDVVDARNQSASGSVFPDLVLDVTHTLCFLDLSRINDIGLLTGSAVSWWLGLVLATLHLWYLNVARIQRTQDLFIRRLFEGAFIEQSLLLNTRFDILSKERRKKKGRFETAMVYLCATMWHETHSEMMNIIISIFRLDKYRPKTVQKYDDFNFEAHIYFDDAFTPVEGSQGNHLNKYANDLVEVLMEVYGIFINIDGKFLNNKHQIPDQRIIRTPYGGRLVIKLPHGNEIFVHFKDKELIRHKKRWSQVMYLYYLLGYKILSKNYARWDKKEDEAELKEAIAKDKRNTYILALDGDTDFQPAAVMLLIDRLKMYPKVGAACGRIHPTGSGPVVWFQKFEYAVSHWLQKTAEHVIGSVLCSPGCFSLFRAEALMDDNVMKTYSTRSTEAQHYVQYDQGEDRWLCTLLLKQGWRVEYNAASDAYTNAPDDFKELYNQRRRWGPSTLANVIDLIGDTSAISKKNPSISKLFMFYQLFAVASSILAPATICLMIAGSLTFVISINGSSALVLAVIPPIIFLILCFKIKSDTQIIIAGIMSILYAFLMMVVAITIIGSMVKENTILTPSSIFVISMASIYIITAIMHPQEAHLVFHGFLYIVSIPSAYLLLIIYSMVNMDNVSWGTRETKPAAQDPVILQTKSQKAMSVVQRLSLWCKCCQKPKQRLGVAQPPVSQEVLITEAQQPEPQPQNTHVSDERIPEEQREVQPVFDSPVQCFVTQLQNVSFSCEMQLNEESLDKEEEEFFIELQRKYLEPLEDNKETKQKIISDLRELRNKVNFAFFMMNALWLVATFTFQLLEGSFAIRIPLVNLQLEQTGADITIDPIAFMFILGFAISVVIQFLTMFYGRIYTLIHYVAFLDTEPKERKPKYKKGKKVKSEDNSDSITETITDTVSDTASDTMSELDSFDESDDDEFYDDGFDTRV
ncbi:chitin synthase chs-1-like [Spinachia spinachia]